MLVNVSVLAVHDYSENHMHILDYFGMIFYHRPIKFGTLCKYGSLRDGGWVREIDTPVNLSI